LNNFEFRLVAALQPIRNLFLAQVVGFGLMSGLFEQLASDRPVTLDRLALALEMNPHRLTALLRYLAAEGIVVNIETFPSLTPRGREYLDFAPWYELFVGGYGNTMYDLPTVMKNENIYADRNAARVGQGSYGIGRYDAIPLVRRLLKHAATSPKVIVDLGCGDGTFLLDLCSPDNRGIGVDRVSASIEHARNEAIARGYGERVSFETGTVEDFVEQPRGLESPFFIAAFLLQEILEQRGREEVITLIRQMLAIPHSYIAVVEVDHRPTDPHVMRHGLGLGYYNAYYLLHQLTEQRLETTAFWHVLFVEAGAKVITQFTTDPEVDSTGLEVGFLLSS
jgi:2-ketoarginine methyltransferase